MKVGLGYKGERIEVEAKPCKWFEKVVGLMFSRREKAKALLLFDSTKPINYGIHSLFVFFSFVAVWLDEENNVVDMKIVKPFRFSVHSRKPFYKMIEIPINGMYWKVVEFLFPRR